MAPRPQPFLPRGIRGRLFLLIALALVPMILLQGWIYLERYNTRQAQAIQTELEVARGVATVFAAYIDDVRRLNASIGEAVLTFESYSDEKITRLLAFNKRQYRSVRTLNWAAPDGTILASSDGAMVGQNLASRRYFREIVGGKPWAVGELTSEGRAVARPTFGIATAAYRGGVLQGVVVAGVDPERLGQLTLTLRRPAGGSYAIFDMHGRVVFRNLTPTLAWEDRVRWEKSDFLLRRTLVTGEPQSGRLRLDVPGGEWFSARVPVSDTGWVAGAGRPVEESLAPVRERLRQDAAFATLIVAFTFLPAWLLARTISRPLERLESDARAMGEGRIETCEDRYAPSEVRRLRGTFQQMATGLLNRAEALGRSEERYRTLADELERRVEERTAELTAANRELEAFTYSVSHDLRAPLRHITSFVELLDAGAGKSLDEKERRYIRVISEAGRRMGNLIDDLLTFSRLGRAALRVAPVSLDALVEESRRELAPEMEGRRIEWKTGGLPRVEGDPVLLGTVVTNLLSNALKYSRRRDPAVIEVGCEERGVEVVCHVRDNGTGFDMRYADKLFGVFQRLHRAEEFEGTGIGLASVRRIVERHGGRVWAEGEVDRGATFYFALPRRDE